MTGIIFATEQEAAAFLKEYERGRFDGLNEGESAQDDGCLVALTGMGKIKATLRSERILQKHRLSRVIHIGTCAALNDELETGTILAINQVFEGDRIELAAPTYPRMPLEVLYTDMKQGVLVTQDHTPQSKEEQTYWQRIADVSDMTGYAIAYVSATHGVPCHLVKVVSGNVRSNGSDFQKRLAIAQKKLTAFLLNKVMAG